MFAKIDVKGADAHPLWVFLTTTIPGFFGSQSIKWNFTKFLCGVDGVPVHRYGTNTYPSTFEKDIVALLEKVTQTNEEASA